ncbi:hypothetical protein LOZ80_10745 [Paenibacillus sp. HWE-109]|uniref:hypothetical protein n=1 Tax=Paenibacillus sp. HWE-109 TaxID=1306526 RepID=UPI001EE0B87E|nr:hypothetical protein [Paenibacillus sp. HWE-109]UKS29374.1 hypothetical protein LOZ80_10745 [Paenibacillus sp. HWE-109]
MALFINQNKAQLAILGPEGNMKYDNLFRIVIKDDNGNSIRISLSFLLNSNLRKLLDANLQRGDKIEVQRYFEEQSTKDLFYPVMIHREDGPKDIGNLDTVTNEPLVKISGVITDGVLPSTNQWNSRQGILFLALEEWFPLTEERKSILDNGKMIEEEWTDTISGTRSVVFIRPLMRDGKVSELIIVQASLQQISEAFVAFLPPL